MPLDITPKEVNKVMITDIAIKTDEHVQVALSEGYDDSSGKFVPVKSVGTILINGDSLVRLVSKQTNGSDIYSNIRDILYAFLLEEGYLLSDGQTVTIQYASTNIKVVTEAGV